MEKQQLKEHARDLFLHTKLHRIQIAEILNIDRKTLYNWIKEGNWLQQRYLDLQGPNRLATQYYVQLNAINDAIARRVDRPYPTKEETDIIRKLNATIQGYKKQQHISDTQQTFKAVMQRIRDENRDTSFASKVSVYFYKHISSVTAHAALSDDINFQKEDLEFETEYRMICSVDKEENGENGELQEAIQEPLKPAPVAEEADEITLASIPQKEKSTNSEPLSQNHIHPQQPPRQKLTPAQIKFNSLKQTGPEEELRRAS